MKTTILEGPDGRLYEIPDDQLARFAVPGPRVAELRKRLGQAAAPTSGNGSGDGAAPAEHMRLGELPPDHPGYPQQQALLAAMGGTAPAAGGGLTLNIYVTGGPAPQVNVQQAGAPAPVDDGGVDGYHMTFDESGIPVSHTEMLWGDYIDKQGNPAVGFHSHDPVHGNAQ